MDIPVTPELFAMQANTRGQQAISEAANEIMDLLDVLTFNKEEERILAILSVLPANDFMRCLKLMSTYTDTQLSLPNVVEVNYLERLYVDLNGAEFDAFCFMFRSRLLAVKCGTLERAEEVMLAAFAGEASREIPSVLDFGPSKLTAPTTFSRRSYPYAVQFAEDGSISGKWADHVGWLNVHPMVRNFTMKFEDLSVARYIHVKDKNEIATAFDIKRMSDENQISFWFTTANIIDIVLGCGAVSAAKGLAKKALAAFIQVAMPALGQALDDHEEWLLESAIGRKLLTAFRIFSLGLAGFGFVKLMSPGGKSLLQKLAEAKNDLLASNSNNGIAQKIGGLVDAVIDSYYALKSEFISTLRGGRVAKASDTLKELRKRAPFHQDVSLPPVKDGVCIGSGKSELEIFIEVRRYAKRMFAKTDKLSVYQKGDDFILVEDAGRPSEKPTGYERWPSFTKLVDFYDDLESAEKSLAKIAIRNTRTKVEVAIYRKKIGDQTYFAVIEGAAEKVNAPTDWGWSDIGHFHHDAGLQPGFKFPALADMHDTMKKALQSLERQTEIIFSYDKSGRLIKVEWGVDPANKASPYFVITEEGVQKNFAGTYPGFNGNPTTISQKIEAIDKDTSLSKLKRLERVLELLSTLDENVYYGAWLANRFK